VLEFNRRMGIRVFRLSSDMIPFGGHPVNRVRWWEEFAEDFARLGELIRDAGLRVSLHPGQYTVLSATRLAVLYRPWLEAAFATWKPQDGSPKVHFSSQAPGQRPGAPVRLVDPDEFVAFLEQTPPRPFDCMLEAKDKDKALFLLREQLAERRLLRSVA
jgi:UV DNA damage repair endonuclease